MSAEKDPYLVLRDEFLRFMTEDSETRDMRRKDYNQAIFNAEDGVAVWTRTNLNMVLDKFDKAVRSIRNGM